MAEKKVSVLIQAIDNFTKTAQRIEKQTGGLSKSFKNLGKVIAGAFATYKAVQFFSDSIKLAEKQEHADIQLAQSIKQAGLSVQEFLPQMKDLASELQATTTYGDEQIEMMESLFLRYGVAPDKMKPLIKATMDYARVTGKDIQSASLDMAKAMQGNLMMLQRYGITISKAKFESEGLDAILKAINERMGGAESAAVNTYAGRIKQLANLFGDLKEQIGNVVIKNEAVNHALAVLSQSIQQITKDMKTSGTSLNEFTTNLGNLLSKIAEGLPTLLKFGATIGSWISKAFQYAGVAIGDYAGALYTGRWNLKEFINDLKKDFEEISKGTQAVQNNTTQKVANQITTHKLTQVHNDLNTSLGNVNIQLQNQKLALRQVNDEMGKYIENLSVEINPEQVAEQMDALIQKTKDYAGWIGSVLNLSDRLGEQLYKTFKGMQTNWADTLKNMLDDLEKWIIEVITRMAILEAVNIATGGTMSFSQIFTTVSGMPTTIMSMSTPSMGGGGVANLEIHIHNATPETYVSVFQNMPTGAKIKIKEALR